MYFIYFPFALLSLSITPSTYSFIFKLLCLVELLLLCILFCCHFPLDCSILSLVFLLTYFNLSYKYLTALSLPDNVTALLGQIVSEIFFSVVTLIIAEILPATLPALS